MNISETKKLHVAIIGSRGYPYVYSGYETFVRELSERLVISGIDVTVYCHRNLFRERPVRLNGINLRYVPTIERKSLSQFVHSFQSILHACFKNYDIVFVVNSANGPFGIVTRIFRKKTVINVDGLEWLRPKWKGFGVRYFYIASKLATRFYDVIVSDSFAMEKIYQELFHASSTVIAYGANIRYSQNPDLIRKWGLLQRDYYLIVGRLIPDNNADFIIMDFLKTGSTKKLVIVGDVLYNDSYAQKIKSIQDDRLIFTGYLNNQSELAELYHHCFAYLHGHEFGGTNPTMLMSLAYGCAILALDTVFTREMLSDGHYGFFFRKEPGSFATLLTTVEKDPAKLENLREYSRERILTAYTWEKITLQYRDLFIALNESRNHV